jgi:RNA polymerase sigma factor for flagellar operon FliA
MYKNTKKVFIKLISLLIAVSFISQDIAFANPSDMLMPESKISVLSSLLGGNGGDYLEVFNESGADLKLTASEMACLKKLFIERTSDASVAPLPSNVKLLFLEMFLSNHINNLGEFISSGECFNYGSFEQIIDVLIAMDGRNDLHYELLPASRFEYIYVNKIKQVELEKDIDGGIIQIRVFDKEGDILAVFDKFGNKNEEYEYQFKNGKKFLKRVILQQLQNNNTIILERNNPEKAEEIYMSVYVNSRGANICIGYIIADLKNVEGKQSIDLGIILLYKNKFMQKKIGSSVVNWLVGYSRFIQNSGDRYFCSQIHNPKMISIHSNLLKDMQIEYAEGEWDVYDAERVFKQFGPVDVLSKEDKEIGFIAEDGQFVSTNPISEGWSAECNGPIIRIEDARQNDIKNLKLKFRAWPRIRGIPNPIVVVRDNTTGMLFHYQSGRVVDEMPLRPEIRSHKFRKDLREGLEAKMNESGFEQSRISQILYRGLSWTDGTKIYLENDDVFDIAAEVLNKILKKGKNEQVMPEQIKAVMEYHEMVHSVLRNNRRVINEVNNSIRGKTREKLFGYFGNQYGNYRTDERLIEELIVCYWTEKMLINALELLDDDGNLVTLDEIDRNIAEIIEQYSQQSVDGIRIGKLQYGLALKQLSETRADKKHSPNAGAVSDEEIAPVEVKPVKPVQKTGDVPRQLLAEFDLLKLQKMSDDDILAIAKEEYGFFGRMAKKINVDKDVFYRFLEERGLKYRIYEIQKEQIIELAEKCNGNIAEMAKVLENPEHIVVEFLNKKGLMDRVNQIASAYYANMGFVECGEDGLIVGAEILIKGFEDSGIGIVRSFKTVKSENDIIIVQFAGEEKPVEFIREYLRGKVRRKVQESQSSKILKWIIDNNWNLGQFFGEVRKQTGWGSDISDADILKQMDLSDVVVAEFQKHLKASSNSDEVAKSFGLQVKQFLAICTNLGVEISVKETKADETAGLIKDSAISRPEPERIPKTVEGKKSKQGEAVSAAVGVPEFTRNKAEAVKTYEGLVRKIAKSMMGKLPASVDVDDLVSNGMIGLLDAIEKYDPAKGIKFEDYASIRIRGAILDGLRDMDVVSRHQRRVQRKFHEAESRLRSEGRYSSEEMAKVLGYGDDIEAYHRARREKSTSVVSLDDAAGEDRTLLDLIADESTSAVDMVARREMLDKIREILPYLTDREREAVIAFYFKGEKAVDIAGDIDVTEGRISQLLKSGRERMQRKLAEASPVQGIKPVVADVEVADKTGVNRLSADVKRDTDQDEVIEDRAAKIDILVNRIKQGDKLEDLKQSSLSLKDVWMIILAYYAVLDEVQYEIAWKNRMQLWNERNYWRNKIWVELKNRNKEKKVLWWDDLAKELGVTKELLQEVCNDYLLEFFRGDIQAIENECKTEFQSDRELNFVHRIKRSQLFPKWYLVRAIGKMEKNEDLDEKERNAILHEFVQGNYQTDKTFPVICYLAVTQISSAVSSYVPFYQHKEGEVKHNIKIIKGIRSVFSNDTEVKVESRFDEYNYGWVFAVSANATGKGKNQEETRIYILNEAKTQMDVIDPIEQSVPDSIMPVVNRFGKPTISRELLDGELSLEYGREVIRELARNNKFNSPEVKVYPFIIQTTVCGPDQTKDLGLNFGLIPGSDYIAVARSHKFKAKTNYRIKPFFSKTQGRWVFFAYEIIESGEMAEQPTIVFTEIEKNGLSRLYQIEGDEYNRCVEEISVLEAGVENYGVINMRDVLYDTKINSEYLRPEYEADVLLVAGNEFDDVLSETKESEQEALKKLYIQRLSPFIKKCYEYLLDGNWDRMPSGFWKGEKGKLHQIILTRYLFENKLGLVMDENTRTIDKIFMRGGHKDFLTNQGVAGWDEFFAKHKLKGMMLRSLNMPNSIVEVLENAYPWAFDYNAAEGQHIHYSDFMRFPSIKDPVKRMQMVRREFRHIFEKHLGFVMDEENGIIDPRLMSPKSQADYLQVEGVNQWSKYFDKYGYRSVVHTFFGDSFAMALMKSYAWAFRLKNKSHLHFWEYPMQGREKAPGAERLVLVGVRHVLEEHYGLKMVDGNIDERLLTSKGIENFSKQIGIQWGELFEINNLSAVIRFFHSTVATLKKAYPLAWDLNTQEGSHIHYWHFNRAIERDDKSMEEAIRHAIEKHWCLVDKDKNEISSMLDPANHWRIFEKFNVNNWKELFENEGLGGVFAGEFGVSIKRVLEKYYPWVFDLSRPEGQHLHDWQFGDYMGGKWTREGQDEMIKRAGRHIIINHFKIPEDRNAIMSGIDKNTLESEGLGHRIFEKRFDNSLIRFLDLCFPGMFPGEDKFEAFVLLHRFGLMNWGLTPREYQKYFAQMLAIRLGKTVDGLVPGDFQKELNIFGGKNLLGLLRHYRRDDMTDVDALEKIRKEVLLNAEYPDFIISFGKPGESKIQALTGVLKKYGLEAIYEVKDRKKAEKPEKNISPVLIALIRMLGLSIGEEFAFAEDWQDIFYTLEKEKIRRVIDETKISMEELVEFINVFSDVDISEKDVEEFMKTLGIIELAVSRTKGLWQRLPIEVHKQFMERYLSEMERLRNLIERDNEKGEISDEERVCLEVLNENEAGLRMSKVLLTLKHKVRITDLTNDMLLLRITRIGKIQARIVNTFYHMYDVKSQQEGSSQSVLSTMMSELGYRTESKLTIEVVEQKIAEKFLDKGFDTTDAKVAISIIRREFGIIKDDELYEEVARLFYTYRFYEILKGVRQEIDKRTAGVEDPVIIKKIRKEELRVLRSHQFGRLYRAVESRLYYHYGTYRAIFDRNKDKINEILGFEIDFGKDIRGVKESKDIIAWLNGETKELPSGFEIHIGEGAIYTLISSKENFINITQLPDLRNKDCWMSFMQNEDGSNKYALIWENEEDANSDGAEPVKTIRLVGDGVSLAQRWGGVVTGNMPVVIDRISIDRDPKSLFDKVMSNKGSDGRILWERVAAKLGLTVSGLMDIVIRYVAEECKGDIDKIAKMLGVPKERLIAKYLYDLKLLELVYRVRYKKRMGADYDLPDDYKFDGDVSKLWKYLNYYRDTDEYMRIRWAYVAEKFGMDKDDVIKKVIIYLLRQNDSNIEKVAQIMEIALDNLKANYIRKYKMQDIVKAIITVYEALQNAEKTYSDYKNGLIEQEMAKEVIGKFMAIIIENENLHHGFSDELIKIRELLAEISENSEGNLDLAITEKLVQELQKEKRGAWERVAEEVGIRVDEVIKMVIIFLMKKHEGDIEKVAQELDMKAKSLYANYIYKYDLNIIRLMIRDIYTFLRKAKERLDAVKEEMIGLKSNERSRKLQECKKTLEEYEDELIAVIGESDEYDNEKERMHVYVEEILGLIKSAGDIKDEEVSDDNKLDEVAELPEGLVPSKENPEYLFYLTKQSRGADNRILWVKIADEMGMDVLELIKKIMVYVAEKCGNNVDEMAKMLGVSAVTIMTQWQKSGLAKEVKLIKKPKQPVELKNVAETEEIERVVAAEFEKGEIQKIYASKAIRQLCAMLGIDPKGDLRNEVARMFFTYMFYDVLKLLKLKIDERTKGLEDPILVKQIRQEELISLSSHSFLRDHSGVYARIHLYYGGYSRIYEVNKKRIKEILGFEFDYYTDVCEQRSTDKGFEMELWLKGESKIVPEGFGFNKTAKSKGFDLIKTKDGMFIQIGVTDLAIGEYWMTFDQDENGNNKYALIWASKELSEKVDEYPLKRCQLVQDEVILAQRIYGKGTGRKPITIEGKPVSKDPASLWAIALACGKKGKMWKWKVPAERVGMGVEEFIKAIIVFLAIECKGDKNKMAEMLGITVKALEARYFRKYFLMEIIEAIVREQARKKVEDIRGDKGEYFFNLVKTNKASDGKLLWESVANETGMDVLELIRTVVLYLAKECGNDVEKMAEMLEISEISLMTQIYKCKLNKELKLIRKSKKADRKELGESVQERIEKVIAAEFEKGDIQKMSGHKAIGQLCRMLDVSRKHQSRDLVAKYYFTYKLYEMLKIIKDTIDQACTGVSDPAQIQSIRKHNIEVLIDDRMHHEHSGLFDRLCEYYGSYREVFLENTIKIEEILGFKIDYDIDICRTKQNSEQIINWLEGKTDEIPKGYSFRRYEKSINYELIKIKDAMFMMLTLSDLIPAEYWMTFSQDKTGKDKYALIWSNKESAEKEGEYPLKRCQLVKDGVILAQKINGKKTGLRPIVTEGRVILKDPASLWELAQKCGKTGKIWKWKVPAERAGMAVEEFVKTIIVYLATVCNGDRKKMAEMLGIDERYLYFKYLVRRKLLKEVQSIGAGVEKDAEWITEKEKEVLAKRDRVLKVAETLNDDIDLKKIVSIVSAMYVSLEVIDKILEAIKAKGDVMLPYAEQIKKINEYRTEVNEKYEKAKLFYIGWYDKKGSIAKEIKEEAERRVTDAGNLKELDLSTIFNLIGFVKANLSAIQNILNDAETNQIGEVATEKTNQIAEYRNTLQALLNKLNGEHQELSALEQWATGETNKAKRLMDEARNDAKKAEEFNKSDLNKLIALIVKVQMKLAGIEDILMILKARQADHKHLTGIVGVVEGYFKDVESILVKLNEIKARLESAADAVGVAAKVPQTRIVAHEGDIWLAKYKGGTAYCLIKEISIEDNEVVLYFGKSRGGAVVLLDDLADVLLEEVSIHTHDIWMVRYNSRAMLCSIARISIDDQKIVLSLGQDKGTFDITLNERKGVLLKEFRCGKSAVTKKAATSAKKGVKKADVDKKSESVRDEEREDDGKVEEGKDGGTEDADDESESSIRTPVFHALKELVSFNIPTPIVKDGCVKVGERLLPVSEVERGMQNRYLVQCLDDLIDLESMSLHEIRIKETAMQALSALTLMRNKEKIRDLLVAIKTLEFVGIKIRVKNLLLLKVIDSIGIYDDIVLRYFKGFWSYPDQYVRQVATDIYRKYIQGSTPTESTVGVSGQTAVSAAFSAVIVTTVAETDSVPKKKLKTNSAEFSIGDEIIIYGLTHFGKGILVDFDEQEDVIAIDFPEYHGKRSFILSKVRDNLRRKIEGVSIDADAQKSEDDDDDEDDDVPNKKKKADAEDDDGGKWPFMHQFYNKFGQGFVGQALMPSFIESGLFIGGLNASLTFLFDLSLFYFSISFIVLQFIWHILHFKDIFAADRIKISIATVVIVLSSAVVDLWPGIIIGMIVPHLIINTLRLKSNQEKTNDIGVLVPQKEESLQAETAADIIPFGPAEVTEPSRVNAPQKAKDHISKIYELNNVTEMPFYELRNFIIEFAQASDDVGKLNIDKTRAEMMINELLKILAKALEVSESKLKQDIMLKLPNNMKLVEYDYSGRMFPWFEGIGFNKSALLFLQEAGVDMKAIEVYFIVSMFFDHLVYENYFKIKANLGRKIRAKIFSHLIQKYNIDVSSLIESLTVLKKCRDIFSVYPADLDRMLEILSDNEFLPSEESKMYVLILYMIDKGILEKDSKDILRAITYLRFLYQNGIYFSKDNPYYPVYMFPCEGVDLIVQAETNDGVNKLSIPNFAILTKRAIEYSDEGLGIFAKEPFSPRRIKLIKKIIKDGKRIIKNDRETYYIYQSKTETYRLTLENGFIVGVDRIWPDETFIDKLVQEGVVGNSEGRGVLSEYVKMARSCCLERVYHPIRIVGIDGSNLVFAHKNGDVIGNIDGFAVLPLGLKRNDISKNGGWGWKSIIEKDCWQGMSESDILALFDRFFKGDYSMVRETVPENNLDRMNYVARIGDWFYLAVGRVYDQGSIRGTVITSFTRVVPQKLNLWKEKICGFRESFRFYELLNKYSDVKPDKQINFDGKYAEHAEVIKALLIGRYSDGKQARRKVFYDLESNTIHVWDQSPEQYHCVVFDVEGKIVEFYPKNRWRTYYSGNELRAKYRDITSLLIKESVPEHMDEMNTEDLSSVVNALYEKLNKELNISMQQIIHKEILHEIIKTHILPQDWHNLVQAMRADGIINEDDFNKIVVVGGVVNEVMKGKRFSDNTIAFVTEAISIRYLEESANMPRGLKDDLQNRLKYVGYAKYADLLVVILRGITMRSNLNGGKLRSQVEIGFIKRLESVLNYETGELFKKLGINEKLSLHEQSECKNSALIRKWADIFELNIRQWRVLSESFANDEVKQKTFNGIIVQDISNLGFGVENWIREMKRLNIDMSGVKMAYVIDGVSEEERKILESRKPANVILGSMSEIMRIAGSDKVVYLSGKENLEKYQNIGASLVESGNAGPVLELALCFMLLQQDNPDQVYSEYLYKLVKLGFVSRKEIESLLLGTVQSRIYKLPKIQKVLEMWNELQRGASYIDIWA